MDSQEKCVYHGNNYEFKLYSCCLFSVMYSLNIITARIIQKDMFVCAGSVFKGKPKNKKKEKKKKKRSNTRGNIFKLRKRKAQLISESDTLKTEFYRQDMTGPQLVVF